MKRYRVILSIPVEGDEEHPASWDWATLLDTTREVQVVNSYEVALLPEEEGEE